MPRARNPIRGVSRTKTKLRNLLKWVGWTEDESLAAYYLEARDIADRKRRGILNG